MPDLVSNCTVAGSGSRVSLASVGTCLHVLNINSEQVTGSGSPSAGAQMPWWVKLSLVTNNSNIRPWGRPNDTRYLKIAHCWTVDDTVATDPIVRVYGHVPARAPEQSSKNGQLPYEAVVGFPMADGFWWPLADEDGVIQIVLPGTSLGNTIGTDANGNSVEMNVGLPIRVPVEGCDEILVLIEEAAVVTNGIGCIIGQGVT